MSSKCKCCGGKADGPGSTANRLECCGGYVHWCGACDPGPFMTFDRFLAKFKRLHAVVCKGPA